ncbi:hypothetical protein STCU_05125 [Strigomonas culicis]|uniref:AAA+ ATPase domain-containing protein n=1 Tax=Strigomonas culicis TaxID=28005 RepID=S9VXS8_9TRYP|nr:hypothetical protein STCU_05125 [Strigomonas culicis]|eukprot:EPY28450.1 hypothetical protein STCU_05125 [Strigomonas culicis]
MPRRPRVTHCGFALVLVLCMGVLAVAISLTAAAAAEDTSEHVPHYGGGARRSLCPAGPICSRAHTPFALKFKYCNKVTSFFTSFFGGGGGGGKIDFRHFPLQLPFATDTAMRQLAKAGLEHLLLMRLIGQDHLQQELLDVLFKKLYFPATPLVLHLAGDNGVGKSYTAKLISLALSLRCGADGDGGCEAGDALLTISGTAYDNEPVALARARIVEQVTDFSTRHPHGVVLLDDVTAMDPELVRSLAPLLGRAAYFSDQLFENATAPDSAAEPRLLRRLGPSLRHLLVIVTTDFGKQGRTVGLTTSEIRAMVLEEFSALYGSLLPAYTRTFIYVPFTEQTAVEVVLATIDYLPCQLLLASGGAAALRASEIDADAAAFLVHKYREVWQGRENGHALRRALEDEVLTPLLLAMEELQQQPARHGRGQRRAAAASTLWDPAAATDVRFFLDAAQWRIHFSLLQYGEVVYTAGEPSGAWGEVEGDL